MVADGERQFQATVGQPAFDAVFRLREVLCEEVNFGEDGFVGKHLAWEPRDFVHGPRMMLFIAVKDGRERTGVGEDAFHLPKPRRCFLLLARSRFPEAIDPTLSPSGSSK